ncbi:MAG: hypothetical protein IJO68_00185 [Clostridia bacterium]|nr:hypothetical protein [Clostridia bacterium]
MTVPETVTFVSVDAFKGCTALKKIVFNNIGT